MEEEIKVVPRIAYPRAQIVDRMLSKDKSFCLDDILIEMDAPPTPQVKQRYYQILCRLRRSNQIMYSHSVGMRKYFRVCGKDEGSSFIVTISDAHKLEIFEYLDEQELANAIARLIRSKRSGDRK